MDKARIRPIAICLLRRGDQILVSEGFDTIKQSDYYRPLGGGVDYGETSLDAARREIAEELGAETEDLKLLGIIENIFIYEGELGHEIVFVYDGKFTDAKLYDQDELDGIEADHKFKAKWRSPEEIANTGGRLVPEELLSLL